MEEEGVAVDVAAVVTPLLRELGVLTPPKLLCDGVEVDEAEDDDMEALAARTAFAALYAAMSRGLIVPDSDNMSSSAPRVLPLSATLPSPSPAVGLDTGNNRKRELVGVLLDPIVPLDWSLSDAVEAKEMDVADESTEAMLSFRLAASRGFEGRMLTSRLD